MWHLFLLLFCISASNCHALKPGYGSDFSEEYYTEDAHPYSFQFEVDAPYHGTWHDRVETSSGKSTEGRFRVALPDHRLQTVRYQATKEKGFQADVQFEQHPDFHAIRRNLGKVPAIGESVVPAFKPSHEQDSYEVAAKPTHQISFGGKFPSSSSSVEKSPHPNRYSKKRRRPSYRPSAESSLEESFSYPPSSVTIEKRPYTGHKQSSKRPSYRPRGQRLSSHTLRPKPVEDIASKPLSAFVSIDALEDMKAQYPEKHSHLQTSYSGYRPVRPSSSGTKVAPSRPLRHKQLHSVKLLSGSHFSSSESASNPISSFSFGDKKIPRPARKKPSRLRATTKPPRTKVSNEIPHVPQKEEPDEDMVPPATQDESFSIANKPHRYSIRRENMDSVRSRLNSIVHNK